MAPLRSTVRCIRCLALLCHLLPSAGAGAAADQHCCQLAVQHLPSPAEGDDEDALSLLSHSFFNEMKKHAGVMAKQMLVSVGKNINASLKPEERSAAAYAFSEVKQLLQAKDEPMNGTLADLGMFPDIPLGVLEGTPLGAKISQVAKQVVNRVGAQWQVPVLTKEQATAALDEVVLTLEEPDIQKRIRSETETAKLLEPFGPLIARYGFTPANAMLAVPQVLTHARADVQMQLQVRKVAKQWAHTVLFDKYGMSPFTTGPPMPQSPQPQIGGVTLPREAWVEM